LARSAENREAARLDAHLALVASEQAQAGGERLPGFVAWLPHAASERIRLQASVAKQRAEAAARRAVLLDRRIEAEALAKALEQRGAERAYAAARQQQAEMDEAAARSRRPTF
jgi:hypothetical protein